MSCRERERAWQPDKDSGQVDRMQVMMPARGQFHRLVRCYRVLGSVGWVPVINKCDAG